MSEYIQRLHEVEMSDVDRVGGKNASLGEMLRNLTADGSVKVPGGFATTAQAYREFLRMTAWQTASTRHSMSRCRRREQARGHRQADPSRVMDTPFPPALDAAVKQAYETLEKEYGTEVTWAVRSATAEDPPTRRLPVSRRRSSTCPASQTSNNASTRYSPRCSNRSRHLLSRASGLRSFAGGAVGRHSENGALGHRCEWRHVHAGYRAGFVTRYS